MTTAMPLNPPEPATPRSPKPYDRLDRMLVAGKWRAGRSSQIADDRDPYTGETLLRIALGDESDVDEAYRGAAAAQPAWAAMLPGERAAILRRAASILEDRREEIVGWLVRESGSTRIKAQIEWQSAHDIVMESASFPGRADGRILPTDVFGKESRVYRQPVGVVAMISPWNFPLHLSLRSTAPALAVGNAVVVKPASDTPVTGGTIIGRIFEEAGLPPGVLSVVVGAGSVIGDPFVLHPVPRVVSFTGSTAVGKRIATLAARSPMLKRVALELGGNGPQVVLDDADLDVAVDCAVFGKFLHQGQICMIINRLIVDTKVHDEFVERYVERVRGLKVGNPAEEDTVVGPVINQTQLEGLLEHIRSARASGARELVGGEPRGLVLPPHVFSHAINDMPIAKDELFGPVVSIIEVEGEEEALAVANATDYGLSSSVITRDVERGVRFALRVQAGMTHVNDSPVNDLPNSPFGGEKNSGVGRYNGEWAIEEFTTVHWISVQHVPRAFPF